MNTDYVKSTKMNLCPRSIVIQILIYEVYPQKPRFFDSLSRPCRKIGAHAEQFDFK